MKFYVSDNIEVENFGDNKIYIKAKIISFDGIEDFEDVLKLVYKLKNTIFEV